jgi:peptidoglycan hydrolase CwlO-like protein
MKSKLCKEESYPLSEEEDDEETSEQESNLRKLEEEMKGMRAAIDKLNDAIVELTKQLKKRIK